MTRPALRIIPAPTSTYVDPPTAEQRAEVEIIVSAARAVESAYRASFLSAVINARLDGDLQRLEEAVRRLRGLRR